MSITVQAWVEKSGKTVYFRAHDSVTGLRVSLTGVPSNPTIKINGVAVTAPYPYGPVWKNGSQKVCAFTAYGISATEISPSTVVTYSAAAGWLTTASGNALAATDAAVANYSGTLPPEFIVNPADLTMPMGINHNFVPAINNFGCNPFKNWRYRLRNPWLLTTTVNPVLNSSPSGEPPTTPGAWAGSAYIKAHFGLGPNVNQDALAAPQPMGRWGFRYRELAVGGPGGANASSVWMSAGASYGGADPVAGPFAAGTRTVNGNVVTIYYTISRIAEPPTNWGPGLAIQYSNPANCWTIADLEIISPGNDFDAVYDPLGIDSNYIRLMTSPSGRRPATFRWNAWLLRYGSDNTTNAADLPKVTDFTWAKRPAVKIRVDYYRYWNTDAANATYAWNTPKVYCDQFAPYASGTDAFGSYIGPLVYGGVSDDGLILDRGGSPNGWTIIEFRCLNDHGLKTGEMVQFPGIVGGSQVVSTTPGGGTTSFSLMGEPDGWPVFVTGPKTFVCNCGNAITPTGTTVKRILATTEIPTNWLMPGTATATSGSPTITFTTSQTNLAVGRLIRVDGDSSDGYYRIIGGGTTSWTMSPVYGGSTASGLTTRVQLEITRYIPDDGIIPFEFAGKCANLLGATPWLNLPPLATDACVTAIIQAFNSTADPAKPVYVEVSNEVWNGSPLFTQGVTFFLAMGRLVKYLPNGTNFNTYYTTTAGTSLGGNNAYVARSARVHDLCEAVVGRSRLIRVIESQANGSGVGVGEIAFCNTWNIPVGGLAMAPYMFFSTDSTPSAAVAAGGGNWSVKQANEWYRNYIKDSTAHNAYYGDNYNNCLAYTGPTGYAGQTAAGKPGNIVYEGSPASAGVGTVPGFFHDSFYDPTNYDVLMTYWKMAQDGSPSVPGSGVSVFTHFDLGGMWDGSTGAVAFSVYIHLCQRPGPGIGTTNTSLAPDTGVAQAIQKYSTPQGGAPGDGKAYDYSNDSVAALAWLTWIDHANTGLPPIPPVEPPLPPVTTGGVLIEVGGQGKAVDLSSVLHLVVVPGH